MEHMQYAPAGGQLFRQRAAMARAQLNADIQSPSKLRKVSLSKLQEKIADLRAKQEPLPENVLMLAGLQRVEFVFAIAKYRDIVVAGPAQEWIQDADGRAVGMHNRSPVLLLEDLLTALRTFRIVQPRGT